MFSLFILFEKDKLSPHILDRYNQDSLLAVNAVKWRELMFRFQNCNQLLIDKHTG